jgi:oligopeptide/dipeptide ABC transporter ATP-binding protein
MAEPILEVRNLKTYLDTADGVAKAVDGVSFAVEAGRTLGIVGESGSGKSMTALSIMQLLPEPVGYIDEGQVLYAGKDLLDLTWSQMREIRGREIAMIFQEPMTSLNPTFTIGNQLKEASLVHGKSVEEADDLADYLLGKVGIENPRLTLRQYPHELSGGMRQRVMIAIALSNRPKVLIADEPTTALDVTVQAQILSLIAEMQKEFGMAVLLITHDLGVIAEMADDVCVMYAGQIVEDSPVLDLFRHPKHPYTQDLLLSLPGRKQRGKDLAVIAGRVPNPTRWPVGCRFANRCRHKLSVCETVAPTELSLTPSISVRCHLHDPQYSGLAATAGSEVQP